MQEPADHFIPVCRAPGQRRHIGHIPRLVNCIGLSKNSMQRLFYLALAFLTVLLSSCEVVGGIFKAGIWTGLILVAIVIAIVIFIVSRFRK
jgi:hypothetical protein